MEGNNSVIKLEGSSNWNIWKFQTVVLLRGQGCLDIVEGRIVKPEDLGARVSWEAKDAKAQTLLVTRMAEKVMLHIITCTTSAEMWKKLQSVYEQKSETSIHIVQQRFFQYKFEHDSEMSSFLSKIQELQNQLKQMGEEISDKFVITKVLMSLPDHYKHFVSAWESAPDDKQTMDNLVARLLVEEERIKDKGEVSEQSSAFVVKDKRNIKCYKCQKLGHYQNECRSKNSNIESATKGNNKCFYCGKIGHSKAQCWFKKNKENKKSNAFVVSNSTEQYQETKWLVDSGASEHMCCDRTLFTSLSTATKLKSVIVGNGAEINVLGTGQMTVQVYNGNEWIDTTVDNVLFVPDLRVNLFSVNRASDKGYVMVTDDSSCRFYKNNNVCAIANRSGSSYYMVFRYKYQVASVAKITNNILKEWHEKLVHQNIDHVKTILRNNNIEVNENFPTCESCLEGKIHRLSFDTSKNITTKTCELIHADTCGPMEQMSIGGSKFFVLLKDDFSNFRYVYFVKNKDEIKYCVRDFLNKAENITGNKIITFRSDNGLEFVNKEMKEMFAKKGITHQTTVPYTPEQNGKAEREIRTLVEAARTMIHAKNMPKKLWAEAVHTAAYVLNRTGKSKENGRSPYEVWTNRSFDINQLKIFGTPVYAHIPKERRRKWDSKARKGYMVGYGDDTKGYRIYFSKSNTIELKRDVIFLEQEDTNEKGATVELNLKDYLLQDEEIETNQIKEPPSESNIKLSNESIESGSEYEPCEEESDSSKLSKPLEQYQNDRPRRVRKQTSFYKCHNVCSLEGEPTTFEEAMNRDDASKWSEAMKKELQTLNDNNTWEFCEVSENENIVSSKWVFKIKRINNNIQYKARLVARGFQQDDSLNSNDIYAPVAKLSTFRLFVAVATMLNLKIYQMDVVGAFLYGRINERVLISLPEGAYTGRNNIVKLNKSLYGLKSSPKCWNTKFNSVITNEGFIKSKSDPCLYSKCNSKDKVYVLLYVDDLLIFGTNEIIIMQLKNILNSEFRMKDLGMVTEFLGINVNQNLETGITELSQRTYLEGVLKTFEMENCKPMSTPLDLNFNAKIFDNCSQPVDKNTELLCRKIIGCLMYAVSGTRPDLCFAVSLLSRYQKCANSLLLTALKRILRYVKYSLDYKLIYNCNGQILEGYCDADWGGDLRDRKSTTGYMFMFSNCLISWSSKKQVSVSLSSTEAEYVAISVAASEACWLINLLSDFNIKNVNSANMFSDNQSAISVACTDNVKRLKHIDIRYHYIKDLIKNDKIVLKYVKSSEQPADMLTKALNKELITKCLKKCGVGNIEL